MIKEIHCISIEEKMAKNELKDDDSFFKERFSSSVKSYKYLNKLIN